MLLKCHKWTPSGIAGAWSVDAIALIPFSFATLIFSIIVENAWVEATAVSYTHLAAGTVKQTVFTMDVQMDKFIHWSSPPGIAH